MSTTSSSLTMLSLFLLLCAAFGNSRITTNHRKNVLFIVSDDMRAQLGAYSGPNFPSPIHPQMITPNLDRLASESLLLTRAYVQQATCSPSRTSFLTSRRPDTTHVYDLKSYFRKVGGNFTTLPQYFKEHGYESVGMGKIFHPGKASGGDDPPSWTLPYFHPRSKRHWTTKERSWYAATHDERKKRPLPDEQIVKHAVKMLRKLAPKAKSGQKPFFLAVGFYKPHLPFVFPEEFLAMYPPSEIHLPPNPYAPENMPSIAWTTYRELRMFGDIAQLGLSGDINTTIPSNVTLDLRRAYYSAVSYIDSLVGKLLAELDHLGLAQSTIISFVGDHGWHLGENGEWTKHTNFEQATHAPMMIRIPGLTDHGIVSDQLVEFVDMYPTIVEAAMLGTLPVCPEESSHIEVCTEGTSLLPLIFNRQSEASSYAFSQWPRSGKMGYTIRSSRYRYTEWPKFRRHHIYKPKWGDLAGVELYDHLIDPEENRNVAYDPEYASVRCELSLLLREGWRGQETN
ncbi:hypothetical protein LSH36_771g00117 [Paralvinella palmiformis]|uniref:Sulfatase N-terminal domain-containing protein n=1 Tax=Paralvinella palmiformis TaxID=53620 RepID=A0AAD9J0F4_9ANNE|nr:hypothetical protein LSH36_771g00117 [Paralvinella palmiformis]